MARKKGSIVYKCSSCGYTQPGWLGRCPQCGEWNTLEECISDPNAAGAALKADGTAVKAKPVPMGRIDVQGEERISTGNTEFDRVLGGGATKRSAILIGGEPASENQRCLSRRRHRSLPGKILAEYCTCPGKNQLRRLRGEPSGSVLRWMQ